MTSMQQIERELFPVRNDVELQPGDTVRVHVRIAEPGKGKKKSQPDEPAQYFTVQPCKQVYRTASRFSKPYEDPETKLEHCTELIYQPVIKCGAVFLIYDRWQLSQKIHLIGMELMMMVDQFMM